VSRHRRKRGRPPQARSSRATAPRPAATPQADAGARPAAAPHTRPARAGARDERPQPPWHPFPLVELCVLVGLVALVLGFIERDSDRGRILIITGMALGSLGGLDTALRDHWAGYRSHATLLASLPAVAAAGVLFFARAPWPVIPAAAVAVFAAAFIALRRVFRRVH
jgi:hypothetical protein